ncbi:MAG: pyruvate dehydrogenase (acetyl-transferring), homodimeric type [Bacteroidales bacterium]|jgi:pyruvate dehydrogenase E1 component
MDNNDIIRDQEAENREWIDSIDYIIEKEGFERAKEILLMLQTRSQLKGINFTYQGNTPYINTIPVSQESPYPGSREMERKIKSIIRWNAMAMVVRANKESDGIGGHISTYASSATLYEVGFNHFFRGGDEGRLPDMIYFQGHASPGIYARSFLEGRLTLKDLENFRRELKPGGGLSSYPHPRSMPDYWQFPTVSMGLGPLTAIYQARFNRYMEDKGLIPKSDQKVWAFLGDGEMDEPESMGALTLASREELDNLIFVVNCNLQRLDGPVRGNGSIVQELESAFHGAGWNVIKVMHGQDWDPLFEKDKDGLLARRFGELVDGQRQRYIISSGDFIRKDFFGKYEQTLKMVEHYSDEQLVKLSRGGHDPLKVYNAYKAAVNHKGAPTVILTSTVKGYGLGEAGEGRNITHQQKKLNEEELKYFRGRFGIPVSDEGIGKAPFYKPAGDSDETKYLMEQRQKLGGSLPKRISEKVRFEMPEHSIFEEFSNSSGDKDVATTMVLVQILTKLLKDKNVGKLIVPIVPDESRTFGMDSLFRQVGIYSHKGQLYEPVDRESLMYYKEAINGAILEEGITEAGSMSSFIAAGTSYSTHGVNAIPFFIFYSMFGFQRVGDLIWAAGDARVRGFMIGGTSGRTTLAGEGLQHQDGNSHLLALTYPSVKAYDPAFAYEVAIIVEEGIKEMYVEGKDVIYYLTVMNEKYPMPAKPPCTKSHILKGMYQYRYEENNIHNVNLLGSGAILNEVVKAADILKSDYDIHPNVWSVTSYKNLYDDAREVVRFNTLNPDKRKESHIRFLVGDKPGLFIAATDYVKAVPLSVATYFPGQYVALGTDGFGLSETPASLRDHFEVDAKHIVWTTLVRLRDNGKMDDSVLATAREKLAIKPNKKNPAAV